MKERGKEDETFEMIYSMKWQAVGEIYNKVRD